MTERPTEPYDPDPGRRCQPPTRRSPPGSRPTRAAPAAPTPATPARIDRRPARRRSRRSSRRRRPTARRPSRPAPTAEPVAVGSPGRPRPPFVQPAAAYSPEPELIDRDRVTWQTPGPADPRVVVRAIRRRGDDRRRPAAPTAQPRRSGGILGAGPRRVAHRGDPRLGRDLPGAPRDRRARPAGGRRRRVPSGQTASAPQPVKIDESSAIIAVAAKVSPAVVRIVDARHATRPTRPRSRPRASARASSTTRTAGS